MFRTWDKTKKELNLFILTKINNNKQKRKREKYVIKKTQWMNLWIR